MQLLSPTSNSATIEACAHEILGAVPPVIWFIREQMKPHRKGLSLPQFRILAMVDRHPAASLSTVAYHLAASLPTTSRIVAGLVAKGLLTRKGCSDDRRQLALAITCRGRNVLDSAYAGTQKRIEAELDGLTAQERTTLLDAMLLLRSKFGGMEVPERTRMCAEGGAVEKSAAGKSRRAVVRNINGGKGNARPGY